MPIRLVVALVFILGLALFSFLFLAATDTALSVWQKMQNLPAWLQLVYAGVLLSAVATTGWLVWRWLKPRTATEPPAAPLTPEQLKADMAAANQDGVDIEPVLSEFREQRRRKRGGEIYIAIHGEVSSGKSSLVKALIPDAEVETGVLAGTTQQVQHFQWSAPSGDRVVVADLPGFNDLPAAEEATILDEARRAHLVLFVADGDLSHSQHQALARLLDLDKPVLLVINKTDRYSNSELELITERLAATSKLAAERIVYTRTGGEESVVQADADGNEQVLIRNREPDVWQLRQAIQAQLDADRSLMDSLRDGAVLLLAAEKLQDARSRHLAQQAVELTDTYSRRAMVGALAAITPGSDLVIQGALATKFIHELCRLYDVRVRDVEVDRFLRLAGGRLKQFTAITMAIAGNALKAFPGIGTITGGLLHAVAYGMIFHSLGRAVADTLASRGELRPYPAAAVFEETLENALESHAGHFARLALAHRKENRNP